MANTKTKRASNDPATSLRNIGSFVWVLIDLHKKKAVKQPIAMNRATMQISTIVLNVLEKRAKGARGFLAIGGPVSYPGTQFPEAQLTQFSQALEDLTRRVGVKEGISEVVSLPPDPRIHLYFSDDCATAQKWLVDCQSRAAEQQLSRENLDQKKKSVPSDKDAAPRQARVRTFRRLIDEVPTGLSVESLVAELAAIGHEFKDVLAKRVEPALNSQARQMPHDTYEEKQALASWVNAQLRTLGLAVKCPKTGKPATFVVDIKEGGSEVSRFRFEIRDDQGKKARTAASRELPELSVVEDEPRREPILTWTQRARERRSGRERK